ncbi:hypothetical protein LENED_003805 [Lentinula edodes]|uniref:Uncharacterized protein n=1 Tax=Lentinula edodes TaxID=5353 RepID=A0A1Q3E557_LENED|nr:hypothetical protein LENED_003805 [Lentinula edodes]
MAKLTGRSRGIDELNAGLSEEVGVEMGRLGSDGEIMLNLLNGAMSRTTASCTKCSPSASPANEGPASVNLPEFEASMTFKAPQDDPIGDYDSQEDPTANRFTF